MTSQAISGDFAKVINFTELKNFTIAFNVFMVVELIVISEIYRFRITQCSINLVKFMFNGFQNFDNNLLLRLKHRNKNFWSENAYMIFGFCNSHYLDQKFDTLS